MARRILILFAVLVAALLVALLLRAGGAHTSPALERETIVHEAVGVGASSLELELGTTVAPVEQRESAVHAARTEASTKAAKPSEGPVATLVVLAVDKASRAPLPSVRISIQLAPPASSSSTRVHGSKGTLGTAPVTATDGRVEFELPLGVDLKLFARGADEHMGSVSYDVSALTLGERRQLTIEFPTGNDLHYWGRVLARDDKSPIAGAKIELIRGESWSTQVNGGEPEWHWKETLLTEHTTGSDGLFELWLPSWKHPDIRIQAPGFAVVLVEVGKNHDTPEKANVVYLARGASLRARLLDARAAAVTDSTVRLWTESFHIGVLDHGEFGLPSIPESEWKASADSSGLCVLQDLPPDVPLHVELIRGGHVVKKDLPALSLSPSEVREVEWTIGSGCLLEGLVCDQRGEVVQGRTICLQRADLDTARFLQKYQSGEVVVETKTSSDGRFAFPDVSQGKWWIGPAAERDDWDAPDSDAIAPVAQVVEVLEGMSRQEVVLRVHRGLYIRGRVLDPAGEPAPDTYLYGSTENVALMISAQTESGGAFALGPLIPGRYSLVAHGWTLADSDPVEASAGDEGVVLRLRAGGSISGIIVDGATGRACAATLTLGLRGLADQGLTMFENGEDEENGAFQLDGLAPGVYDISARASGQRVGILRGVVVQAGIDTSKLVVTLAPGATLRVKYAGKDRFLSYRILSEGVPVAGDGIQAGGSKEIVVPSGRLTIECRSTGESSETKEIELAVGEQKELVFGGK